MALLANKLELLKRTPSDISEHLETLRALAFNCSHVTEFGARTGLSTTAILAAHPKVFHTYDINIMPEIYDLYGLKGPHTKFKIFLQSTIAMDPIEETDMLFIDTQHNYDQLSLELKIHGNRARKYLVFHDTETYKYEGDPAGTKGLWPAIEEWLAANPHWIMKMHFTNNNGLTVLERI